MKPASFDYHCPTTVAETVGLLRSLGSEAKLLAGGQSLVPLMNLRLARPGHLIDLNRVTDLVGVAESAGVLELGALLCHRTLATHPTIASRLPLLAEAAGQIGHPAIRGRGTLGGSLAHADPAGELPTVAVALDATLVATSASATRLLPADGFFTGPLSTILAEDELLVSVRVPLAGPPGTQRCCGFAEFARRRGDFALVLAAVVADIDPDGVCQAARIVIGAVAPQPWRCAVAEAELVGQPFADDHLDRAAAAAMSACQPTADVHGSAAYRRALVGVIVGRALRQAREQVR